MTNYINESKKDLNDEVITFMPELTDTAWSSEDYEKADTDRLLEEFFEWAAVCKRFDTVDFHLANLLLELKRRGKMEMPKYMQNPPVTCYEV
jgi:hypothetical protein|tara:strand:- start:165 stop:440 length:276 start_codon:yes stop_codon:yes gene_type:complete